MALLNADEKRRVAEAVAQAETRTAGEIVVVTAEAADDYAAYRALYALGSAVLISSEAFVRLPHWPPWLIFSLQIPLAFGLFTLCGGSWFVRRFVPRKRRVEAVDARAKQAFVEFGLTETRDRSGVLILVSEREHRVQILADRGVNERVAEGAWQADVDLLIAAIVAGKAGDGLVTAVTRIGEVLAQNFPQRPDDTNELTNEVREI